MLPLERRARQEKPEEQIVATNMEDKAATNDEKLVKYMKHGEGVVEKEDEDTITVRFKGYGSKTFSKLFLQLEYL